MAYSNYATTDATTAGLPPGVSFLTATAVSASRIDLAWTTIPDAVGYRLERLIENSADDPLTEIDEN